MPNNELLIAISDMMDTKLRPVNEQLERMEQKLGTVEEKLGAVEQRLDVVEEKLDAVEQRLDVVEEKLGAVEQRLDVVDQSLEGMEQRLKKIEFAQENIILPRLQNIEACYTSTYERYRDGVDQIVSMQSDIDVIITTITRHSEILQKFA